jgi:hypothetical protein
MGARSICDFTEHLNDKEIQHRVELTLIERGRSNRTESTRREIATSSLT